MLPATCSVAVCSRNSTAHCSMKCGTVQHEFHCPLSLAAWQFAARASLPTASCSVAVCCQSFTAHCPLQCGSEAQWRQGAGGALCRGNHEGSKAQATCTSSPPKVDPTVDPKQTADTETRGPAVDPQPPARGRAMGTQQTGLTVSFRDKVQGPPILHFPMCKTSRPLTIGNSAFSTPHNTTPRHAMPCHATPHHITPHHTTPHHTTPPHNTTPLACYIP